VTLIYAPHNMSPEIISIFVFTNYLYKCFSRSTPLSLNAYNCHNS